MDTEYFLAARPASPWLVVALVAAAVVALTLWAYLKHPQASRRRVLILLLLRFTALLVALLTAARPSVGIHDDPKLPSTLLVGIDLSESMTVRDEFDTKTRIEAVRKVLDRCKPTLDAMQAEKNVQVVMYALGSATFAEATDKYDPAAPSNGKTSDYGTYLARTLDKWQTERFVRGHLLIGDGIDNGTRTSAVAEAARWRAVGPVHTFSVGKDSTNSDAKDVAVVAADPAATDADEYGRVAVKNPFTLRVRISNFGFTGAKVPVVVKFDGKQVAREEAVLAQLGSNEANIPLKAPDVPAEVRITIEVPIDSVPGDVAPPNNVLETFITFKKEGVRVLLVDRLGYETTQLRTALRGGATTKIDLAEVIQQGTDPAGPDTKALFDFDTNRYDAIILRGVSGRQLQSIDPKLMERIRDQVLQKGVGLLMTGGDASFAGSDRPLDDGWRGTPIERILPVELSPPPADMSPYRGDDKRYQTVPTLAGLRYLFKSAPTEDASKQLWDRLNGVNPPARMTAINWFGAVKKGATVYADARPGTLVPAGLRADGVAPPHLLVGWELGDAAKGRVLAFAGYDTFLWKSLGLRDKPPTRAGTDLHAGFWRRMVLWLAHQETEEGAATVRPTYRRLPVRTTQTLDLSLRQPGGADALNPQFVVKVIAPGQRTEEAAPRPWVPRPEGGGRATFDPPVPGEYEVTLDATGTDGAGKEIKAQARARFLAYPEVSDELVKVATEDETLKKLAAAGGGRAYKLDDLPGFLAELANQPLDAARKKPRYVPDWGREKGKGFLTVWLVLFVLVVGAEWGLRRWWGLA